MSSGISLSSILEETRASKGFWIGISPETVNPKKTVYVDVG